MNSLEAPPPPARTLTFSDPRALRRLCGDRDANLKALERHLGVAVSSRGDTVHVSGEAYAVGLVCTALEQLFPLAERGATMDAGDVVRAVDLLATDGGARIADTFLDRGAVRGGHRRVVPKSPRQKTYLDAIRRHDLVFGVGPAGTGKTYLAMAMAVQALLDKQVSRIILTRPAVEAGERLGFLPGDLVEKVNPYLRPLYDALHDMLDVERAHRLTQRGQIEVAPLAFMRGRTLNDAFIVLDEAQNTTREQMKMFLTRLGFGSKAVVTGDITQVDLPDPGACGLRHAVEVLDGIEGLAVVHFGRGDVVRHPLVQRIVDAYEKTEAERAAQLERERRRARVVRDAVRALDVGSEPGADG